jgi:hypothetical protein
MGESLNVFFSYVSEVIKLELQMSTHCLVPQNVYLITENQSSSNCKSGKKAFTQTANLME